MRFLLLAILLLIKSSAFAQKQVNNIVAPVDYFVNHIKPLKDLKNNLVKFKKSSLVGTSGIGKTQVARTYAYENKAEYKIIWFFDCNLDIDTQFVKFAKALNKELSTNISLTTGFSKREIMEYLENKNDWLLVFDNLKVGDNYKAKDIIEWDNNGHLLFCSQEGENLPYIVELTKFAKNDAITLAKNIMQEEDPKALKFLEETFQGYPILIVQGAQLLNNVKDLDKETYKKTILYASDKIKTNIILARQKLSKSALDLLDKIALINNQSFSKQVLSIITDSPSTLDEDVYELTKYALIANIDASSENSIYEIHDVLVNKIQDISGAKRNSKLLEIVTRKFTSAIPKNVVESQVFRAQKTVFENLQILEKNSKKYSIDSYTLMELKLHLLTQYVNNFDLSKSKILVNWFNQYEKNNGFKLSKMSDFEKGVYARYLGIIGWYYRKLSDFDKAIYYFEKSLEACRGLKGLEAFECNAYFGLSIAYNALGRIAETEQSIIRMEKMFDKNLVVESDIGTLYSAKVRLYYIQGNYDEALNYVLKTIDRYVANGDKKGDLLFSELYLMRAEIFNALGKPNEAIEQLNYLLGMYKSSKNKIMFGRIYAQLARSKLIINQLSDARRYIEKAINNFTLGSGELLGGTNSAAALSIQGQILEAEGKLKESIDSYRDAQKIYFYLYRDNRKNVAQVSELYLKGAMASCRAKDLYHYKCFGEPQIKEFGRDHPNSIKMLDFCQSHNMNLWAKES